MFKVVVSDRLETLADALAVRLAGSARGRLFDVPTIVVPSHGIERWLSMRLALRFGIWAGGSFPFPETWVDSLAAAVGLPQPNPDPWSRGAVECALYDALRSLDDPDIRTWIGDDPDGRRTLSFARQAAECFDQYAVYRPDLLLMWDDHRAPSDPRLITHGAAWQARLWRALVARLGPNHPARRLQRLGEELTRRRAPLTGLPLPLHVFGVTALPPIHVDVIAAFGRLADATVWVVDPCREMWFEARPRTSTGDDEDPDKEDAASDALPSLLALNGRLGRDFLARLYEAADWQVTELWSELSRDPPGVLGALRRRIVDGLREPRSDEPRPLWPDDTSAPTIALHICHSPRREVEVLRDRLLDLFDRQPDLAPRDVLVMAPDIEPYVSHISAVFGADDPPLPYSIADRSPLLIGHLAEAVRRLLRLPDGEATALDLFDLLALPPVRARFDLSEDQLARIRDWIGRAAIRRGGDEPDRPNSWRGGLERLTLGAMVRLPSLELVGDRLPVEVADLAALDALWAFWAVVRDIRRELAGPHPSGEWAERMVRAMDRLLCPAPEESAEYAELRRTIAVWNAECAAAGLAGPLPLPVARVMIEERLDPSVLAAPFLRSGITFCNLRPMRSVPFRVIALLGMNDAAFPRRDTPPPFDLIRAAPRRGDRWRRLDDRQLFLETLLAARDHLHISYVGRDARTNEPRPPSICVGELLDVLDRTFDTGGRPARERITIEHPLQPFSPRYFCDDGGPLFSYSARARRAAAALGRRAPAPPPAILSLRLPPPSEPLHVSLEDLARFFRDPVSELLHRRLDVTVGRPGEDLSDAEPLPGFDEPPRALLRTWIETSDEALGDRPVPLDRVLAAAGHRPPGAPGRALVAQTRSELSALVGHLAPLRQPPLPVVALRCEAAGRAIVLDAAIADRRPDGLIRWTPGPIRAGDLLEAWLAHLVLHSACPGCGTRTLLVGTSETVEFPPTDDARALLDRWIEALAEGITRPLPIWPECAVAYARAPDPENAAEKARATWSDDRGTGLRDRRPLLRALFPSDHDIVTPDFLRLTEALYRPLVAAAAGPLNPDA